MWGARWCWVGVKSALVAPIPGPAVSRTFALETWGCGEDLRTPETRRRGPCGVGGIVWGAHTHVVQTRAATTVRGGTHRLRGSEHSAFDLRVQNGRTSDAQAPGWAPQTHHWASTNDAPMGEAPEPGFAALGHTTSCLEQTPIRCEGPGRTHATYAHSTPTTTTNHGAHHKRPSNAKARSLAHHNPHPNQQTHSLQARAHIRCQGPGRMLSSYPR